MLKSITVREYMSASLVTFTPETDVLRAIHQLIENRIAGAPVVDEHGTLIGMLSEKDCLRVALDASYNEFPGGKVKDYMSNNVVTVEVDNSIVEVAKLFLEGKYRRFPVLDDDYRLVGQISRRDVLRALEYLW